MSQSPGIPETAHETARAVGAGRLRARDRVEASLARIAEVQPRLNAFTLVLEDEARAAADALDKALTAGARPGPLCGVPVAIKDFTPTRGHLTTRGSWSTGDRVPQEDPVLVRRLKAAGAIIVGKTTTPEFAYSSFTHSPRWGVTRNAHAPDRTPGGSSGGSAGAVATGCVPVAEGTDMGGSVRIPAALSGVVGLKPSLGRIPMDILPTVFDDISHFGPLAGTVDDAALFLAVTQGPDDADILSQAAPAPLPLPVPEDVRGLRLALSVDLGYYAVAPGVAEAVTRAAGALEDAGAVVEPVDLAWTREINDTWLAIWGVALAAAWSGALADHRDRMDPALVALMEDAFKLDAVGYKRMESVRTRLWHDLAHLFRRYDALLCPTCAVPAPPLDADDAAFEVTGADGRFHGLDMTCPFNLVGQCPAVSVPAGLSEGLPVGLQIVGRRFADTTVLRVAKCVETALPRPQPPL